MFKSLFGDNTDNNLIKVADIAFEGRNQIETMFEPLTTEGQAELYLFNIVYSWLYLQDHSIVQMNAKNAERFTAIGAIKAQEIKASLDVVTYFQLFKDRFINYREEMQLVTKTQFTQHEHFPIYFYRRIYHHPLSLVEMPEIEEWDDEYYEGDMLLDIYKHQANHIQNNLVKTFGKK